MLSRDNSSIIPLSVDYLESIEEIETTIIKLPVYIKCTAKITGSSPKIEDPVHNYGHLSNMPIKKARWNNNLLVIEEFSLNNSSSDSIGKIVAVKNVTINSNDVNLKDVKVIQPSFKANVGMSTGFEPVTVCLVVKNLFK